jgi:succinyl-diaminopimelate desuccinylase
MRSEVEKLAKRVEELRQFSTDLLANIVSIPTVVPPGEMYREFIEFSKELLSQMGIKSRVIKVPKKRLKEKIPEMADYPRYMLYCRIKGEQRKKSLHFNGHYDVVPPGDGWTVTKPFEPKIVGNRIYGRGSSDMKGGIVSAITAIKSILDNEATPKLDVELSLTPDEEIGGICGVKYLLEQDIISKPCYVIIPEPSGRDQIWIGHKGALWGELRVYGKAAHAAIPWKGVNAFEKTVYFAEKLLRELKPKIESKITKYETATPEGKRASIVLGSLVKGGTKINIVPDKVTLHFDRRILPEERLNEVISELDNFIQKARNQDSELKVDFEVLFNADPSVISSDAELVKGLRNAVNSVLKINPRVVISNGFLDTRHFVNEGYDAVAYGPGEISQAHSSDEYIEIDKMIDVGKVFAVLACDWQL